MRLRLLEQGQAIHPHRQLAALLLMPAPVRGDEALGSGQPILKSDRYAIEHIAVPDATLVGDTHAILTVGTVILRNYDLHAEELNAEERLADVEYLWAHAGDLPSELKELLLTHQTLVRAGEPIRRDAEELVRSLQNVLTDTGSDYGIFRQGGEDVLRDILHTVIIAAEPPQPPIHVDQVDPNEVEIKRRTVREWRRWAASRGAKSARFRQEVRHAYNWTCLVCGSHLPRTAYNPVAGVDAAHILPWSEYDLDHPTNGLCLCRLHHWAFDEGLLTIDERNGDYVVEVPAKVKEGILEEYPAFSLHELMQWEGIVPEERLPIDRHLRPDSRFLKQLYQHFFENL